MIIMLAPQVLVQGNYLVGGETVGFDRFSVHPLSGRAYGVKEINEITIATRDSAGITT